ncbi:Planctomycete cytochrome C [Thalassoglobus neptunius]|uniref:Planctomycete cytochrome C n=1 Tax=Thalassoglobus neptunius TaxID=1938619 RepID=A0A5C5W8J1_9PLAN|nr:DUF1553 domain-containing protein [Thalassoglobus neptunius]TWT46349.1 Planctomycete cytochrome C [Thalassoglobus neptunius]
MRFWANQFSILALISFSSGTCSGVDFEKDVLPIFQDHCSDCHSADDRNGGLSFDDRKSVFHEADSGEMPVVPGAPESSEILQRVTTSAEELQMPPDGDRLSMSQIEILRQWIIEGADWSKSVDPDNEETEALSDHWSFQPIRSPNPPEVNDESWAYSPLDRFLQARRESEHLQPVPDASPIVLIRRATYGLTGLPPTPEEIDHFLQSVEEQGKRTAFAQLVDGLLSRPSYGERWGRHWMDWVRYADTAGDNSDFPIPQAFLYRNYIIESFNNDLPYDRFLTEQIAGDLLPAETIEEQNRQLIATGYLAMSRRFGSLVERYPWHLTIEDTIDNLGRTVLGLTISCARCHDHKFDPISTRDYYGLYGIFSSTRYPFPGLELFQTQHDLVPLVAPSEVEAITGPFQEKTVQLENELKALLDECEERSIQNASKALTATVDEQRKMRDELDAMLIRARRAGEKLAAHLKEIPPVPSAYAVKDATPHDSRVQIKGEPDRLGAVVPRHFPEVLGGQTLSESVSNQESGRRQLAQWLTDENNPLTARVIVNRVWQRHFGVGIVSSTSDFGLRGQVPKHPELLDWLATDFMNHGWSIKHLHRRIMNSRAYQLSSEDLEENLKTDPSNTLYWKFHRQRLDAESIRDTLLILSNALDTSPQTEPYAIPPYSKWKYTQHHPFKDDYPSNKRSVYLMTRRLTAKPYFQTFDGPDPNVCTSDRDESVTPLQALYFVNDEFLHEQAEKMAAMWTDENDSESADLRHIFKSILCRDPSPEEHQLMLQHLEAVRDAIPSGAEQEKVAMASLVRSLLRLNEFLYID